MSKRFYIAHRVDGKPGRGTKANPFNGSGEQFDFSIAKIRRLTGVNDPVTLQLGAGEFRTAGISWRPHWKGIGAGLGKTCLSLADVRDSHFRHPHIYAIATPNYHEGGEPPVVFDARISDLTVDCRWEHQSARNQPGVKVGAIYLFGVRAAYENVRATNFGSNGLDAAYSEVFPLFIETPNREDAFAKMSACIVDHQCEAFGGQATGFNITTIQDREKPSGDLVKFGERSGRGGLIERCVSTVQRGHGFGCGWAENIEFRDNLAVGCKLGFICDTGLNRGILFAGNRFVQCHQGFHIGQPHSGEFRDFVLQDNHVSICGPWLNTALAPAREEYSYGVKTAGRCTNTIAKGNRFVSEVGLRSKEAGYYGVGTPRDGEQIAWQGNEFVDLADGFVEGAPVYID